jgi:hypothetical protein
MQNTGKRCVILLVFIILRWSFNYESNVFRYNKILIDCVFGNSKFVVPIRVWFFGEIRLQHKCTWWLQVLWQFWFFLKFFEIFEILKIFENFQFLFLILEFWKFSLIGNEVRVFRISDFIGLYHFEVII